MLWKVNTWKKRFEFVGKEFYKNRYYDDSENDIRHIKHKVQEF